MVWYDMIWSCVPVDEVKPLIACQGIPTLGEKIGDREERER